jgi:hypothetical protein
VNIIQRARQVKRKVQRGTDSCDSPVLHSVEDQHIEEPLRRR